MGAAHPVLLLFYLIIDWLGPVEWTKLCSLSRRHRALLDDPLFWKILFRNHLSLAPSLLLDGHRDICIAVDAFLFRRRAQPHDCEQPLWQSIHQHPELSDALRRLCQHHARGLFRRWTRARQYAHVTGVPVWNWSLEETLPDSIGTAALEDSKLNRLARRCRILPQTACFWRPEELDIEASELAELPAAMGCWAGSLRTLRIASSRLAALPSSFFAAFNRTPHSSYGSAASAEARNPRTAIDTPLSVGTATSSATPASTTADPSSRLLPPNAAMLSKSNPGANCHASNMPPGCPLQVLVLSCCSSLNNIAALDGLARLQVIDLSRCISMTHCGPLKNLEQLRSLSLVECISLTSLSLSNLPRLQTLNMRGCRALESVDSLDGLVSLTDLDCSGCGVLRTVGSLSALEALVQVDFSDCRSLLWVGGLDRLVRLAALRLGGCARLPFIGSLERMTNMTHLNLSGCVSLEAVGPLDGLLQLRRLEARGCTTLGSLGSLAQLSLLKKLDLAGCTSLRSIDCLGDLPCLRELDMSGCKSLRSLRLPRLPLAVEELVMTGCESLSDIRTINRQLPRLERLDLSGCWSLESIGTLEGLDRLQSLDLSGCWRLKHIGSLESSTRLTSINCHGCALLQGLGPLPALATLEMLDLWGCRSLSWAESEVPTQPMARRFRMTRASTATSHGACLETLALGRSDDVAGDNTHGLQMDELAMDTHSLWATANPQDIAQSAPHCDFPRPGLPSSAKETLSPQLFQPCHLPAVDALAASLGSLRKLDLTDCRYAVRLDSILALSELEELAVSFCPGLRSLEPFARLARIKYLSVTKCDSLDSLRGLRQLTALESLVARQNAQLRLPHDSHLLGPPMLRCLDLGQCGQLTTTASLARLFALEILDLSGCQALDTLAGLEELPGLRVLDISRCPSLTSTSSLAGIASIEVLSMARSSAAALSSARLLAAQLSQLSVLDLSPTDLRLDLDLETQELMQIRAQRNLPAMSVSWLLDLPPRAVDMTEPMAKAASNQSPSGIFAPTADRGQALGSCAS
ncbi:uncharacterized protein BJ171DRAFT_546302 [Polychytrium aggregatum]|uniref:uncharacterized protein n=1 Tax=Polychytrium aggregatum TaxID=110093 RepID=UPI0022FE99A1|nr:uncharacterized protein BJ171DRAFT_546302 [Polychytrium aggregatum]KAI9190528.1 hypothetical protein BJ171DRAFT_546302 [Polychytrium aggregatum]